MYLLFGTALRFYQGVPVLQEFGSRKSYDWPLEFCMVIGRMGKFFREILQLANTELRWPVTTFHVPIFFAGLALLGQNMPGNSVTMSQQFPISSYRNMISHVSYSFQLWCHSIRGKLYRVHVHLHLIDRRPTNPKSFLFRSRPSVVRTEFLTLGIS